MRPTIRRYLDPRDQKHASIQRLLEGRGTYYDYPDAQSNGFYALQELD